MMCTIRYRQAVKEDAADLARLIDYAGEGVPVYYWNKIKPADQDVWAFGASRAAREEGAFSYRNAIVATVDGDVVGCAIRYVIDAPAEASDYSEMPPMFVPMQQLEDLAVGTEYLNVLAVDPEFRGRGIGTRLCGMAEINGNRDQTLIAFDTNTAAIKLYRSLGFEVEAARPMVKEDWDGEAETLLLMRRPGRLRQVA
ncbi:N-acetyltransferase [Hwanghaeella grinnelliae]|uniref:N-acetyltransferase n=1 Tax=Hwanghaeella grinnelliae TaxID=2500179 RepID=A0A437QXZ7_9PROT|nr:GNAT family N-acetyltransferase [Hwanghaeella grinnelliae]RVU39400.1 N-acetyltransferase [Hwanghaeella grinnelliae]